MATQAVEGTRERITRVATELFYEKGYHGTTMREIAAGVNIKAGSVYNHFDSKQELLNEVSLATTQSLYEETAVSVEGVSDVEDQLQAFVKAHVEFHAHERLAARVTDEQLHALEPANRKRVLKVRDAHEKMFRDILVHGAKTRKWKVEDPVVIAFAILTMCTQVDVWYREDGRLSPEQIGEMFARFILSGLRNGKGSRR